LIPPYTVGEECKVEISPLWRAVWQFLMKYECTSLPYNLATPFLGIYPREMKTDLYKNVYGVALFIITPNWKQLKCPSAMNRLNKL